MLYSFIEMSRAAMLPWRAAANVTRRSLRSPLHPAADTLAGRATAAAADLFESLTRYYGKPEWGLSPTEVEGRPVDVSEEVVWRKPFCSLLHFKRDRAALAKARGIKPSEISDRKVLIVAPMSGHHATLLRGTVEAFLPENEVYITDWTDARKVPVMEGRFDLDDYVLYVREMITALGGDVHVVAVCQPGPPTLAAIALMAEDEDPARPLSMTFMGSPIDARKSPTVPNKLAQERPYSWFRDNLIHTVPAVYPGGLRRVYPGFLQLTGFINMNFDRHVDAHWRFFTHMVEGDGDSAEKHRQFYDEYLSVMDLTEEFYLQTIRDVFQEHKLARGEMTVAEAASDKYRLGAKELCYARPIEGADELPAELADMISQSRRLYARIDRLDKMMHGDASETEPKTAVARQLSKIESAFRQMRLDGQLH